MEQLPYIDEHRICIDGAPAAVWFALLAVLRGQLGTVPGPLARAWGLSPRDSRGNWSQTPEVGDAIPGFEVDEAVAGERLVLVGQHRFSRYALVFELDPTGDECTLRAQSWAGFPGIAGAAYRAMVIGSRGHRVAVRRLLRSVQRRVAAH
jgi:hypothetical protein